MPGGVLLVGTSGNRDAQALSKGCSASRPAVVYAVEGIERAIGLVVPVLVAAIVINVLRFGKYGGASIAALQCVLVCALLATYFRRNSLSPEFRLSIYALTPYSIAVVGLLYWSLCGIGILLFVISGILASMAGLRYWVGVSASAVLICILIGAGHVSGFLVLRFDPALYVCSVSGWANALVGLITSSLVALIWERLAKDLEHRTRALQESEGKLRAILDHQYQFTGLLDVEGRLVAVNPSALKFAGVTDSEVLGSPFWETPWWGHSREMQDKVKAACRDALSGESPHFQCTNIDASGALHTIDFSLRPVTDGAGEVRYLVPEGRDVTNLMEVQEALRSSLADLQSVFQQAAVGIAYTDLSGHYIRVNRCFADMLRYDLDEFTGRRYTEFLHPEDCERVGEQLKRMREQGLESCSLDLRFLRKDEGVVWTRLTGSAVPDSGGRPAYNVSIVEDITEQKKMQDALDAIVSATSHVLGKEFFRSLVRHLAEVLDVRCAIVAELGDENATSARTLAVWSNGSPAENSECALKGTCYEQTLTSGLWACIDGLRGLFPADARLAELGADSFLGTVLRDAAGNPLGFLAVLDSKPFTQIRLGTALLEVFSARAAAEVERIRAEEQARFQQQQLIQADKLASLGVLVAGVAHEINNPNGYIHLGVDMLEYLLGQLAPTEEGEGHERRMTPEEARKEMSVIVEQMRDGTERIARIVSDLRDFARQGSSGMEEAVDLNAVAAAACRLTSSLVKKSTDCFEAAFDDNLPPVWGNAQRLEQVVVNLLTNACQALPGRNRQILLRTRFNPLQGTVVLEVEDEGSGMEPEVLKRITDPFYTTKRDRGGTGLGLSISTTIISDHGGTLHFTSAPGKGTRATVELPGRMSVKHSELCPGEAPSTN